MTTLHPTTYNPSSNLGIHSERKDDTRPVCPDCGKARLSWHKTPNGEVMGYWECGRGKCGRRIYVQGHWRGDDECFAWRCRPMCGWPLAEGTMRGPFASMWDAIMAVAA